MKKIPTLFKREFGIKHSITISDEVTAGCEWVLENKGVATVKFDGTCTLVLDGELWKRFDAKKGKPVPVGAIKCQEHGDAVTGHLPCWVKVEDTAENKWFTTAFKTQKGNGYVFVDGTYELCGVHFQSNSEKLEFDQFMKHGSAKLNVVDRTFDGIKKFLTENYIEGIVFHRENGDMCKIKRTDFNLEWNNSNVKRK